MTITSIIFFFIVFGLSLFLIFLLSKKEARGKNNRFINRPDMGIDEFYSCYYRSAGIPQEKVAQVLREIGNARGISECKIRPSDRFNHELAPLAGWEFGDGLIELSWIVNKKTGKIKKPKTINFNTVDDLISFIASKDNVEPSKD
ncbi:MAG: hypothetical protein JW927_18455 [Deltaproteobacteria bacterium]|nr:hypothetical protein [Deltaproteobacteria bacterium]